MVEKILMLPELNNRKDIRNYVISEFLNELPGRGKKEFCSKYIYRVECIGDKNEIYIRRPAALNKGMDFTIHVKNYYFRKKGGNRDAPSHKDIICDLKLKKSIASNEYCKINEMINKIYKCETIGQNEYKNVNIEVGLQSKIVINVIKWLFIEQDVTYWNWSGRAMLMNKLIEEGLA